MADRQGLSKTIEKVITMFNEDQKQQLQKILTEPILFDEPMARHTTIRVGGPADAIVSPASVEELQAVLQFAGEQKLPIFPLGWGSNLLVRDRGLRGLVIHLGRLFQQIEPMESSDDTVTVKVGATVKMPALLDYLATAALTGLEFMAGIPATVGGAIWMNAGTPDGEIGSRIQSVTIVTRQGRVRSLDHKACGFAYRSTQLPAHCIVINATIQLQRGDATKIEETIDRYKSHRIDTQPLTLPNLGSVFKNPTKKQHAGRLIEEAGLKDVRVGQARISEKHGNFIVNEGKATANDVIALIGLIKDKVKEKCQVRLETEVQIVGERDS